MFGINLRKGFNSASKIVLLIFIVLFVGEKQCGLQTMTASALNNAPNKYENNAEQLLIERLFKNYNRKLRPPGTVQVKFALNLNQIVNLNQKDQIIVLNAFIDHEWIDPRLSWG
jgi:hypothetical protein